MKFQLIPVGTRFRYEGRTYVKTGPLTASGDEGGQRIIPRYAVLSPVGEGADAPAAGRGNGLDPAAVIAAFEAFHAASLQEVDEAGRERLEALRRSFYERLGLRPQ